MAEQGFRVLVADNDWQHIRAARMNNLATYFGHVVSQHADQHLDLIGIGRLLRVISPAQFERPGVCATVRNSAPGMCFF
ncbi:MAG: hypothetical protein R3F37_17555 [Candidatus Competibacteraceae bacterium]